MKKLIEKQKSTELAFNGRFLKVWRDIVELPSGYSSFREYIKHPGAACIVPILPNGNLMMIKQFRYSAQDVFIEFPAGKKDKGETTVQTAHRELEEEIGYKAQTMKFMTRIHPVIGYSDEIIDLYIASDLVKTIQNTDPGEELILFEVTPKELEEKIWAGEITDVKTQIAAFWYFKLTKNL